MVCRTNAILADLNRVSYVGRALGHCRLVVVLPTSQASFFWLVVCLPSCVQNQFRLHCWLCPLKWNTRTKAPDCCQFWIANWPRFASLANCSSGGKIQTDLCFSTSLAVTFLYECCSLEGSLSHDLGVLLLHSQLDRAEQQLAWDSFQHWQHLGGIIILTLRSFFIVRLGNLCISYFILTVVFLTCWHSVTPQCAHARLFLQNIIYLKKGLKHKVCYATYSHICLVLMCCNFNIHCARHLQPL